MRHQRLHGLKLLPILLVTFLKLDIKILLLEISYTEINEHEEMHVILIKKHQPYWVAFIELEGTMHSTKRENISEHQSYPATYKCTWPANMSLLV